MQETPVDVDAARNLRFLTRLVTVLTVSMILGLMLIFGLMAMRLSQSSAPSLPQSVTLPDGATAQAITAGAGWYGVVTDQNTFLIFDADTGALRQTVTID